MAESESGQERSEDATSKRKENAREEGQVARSRELNTMFILMVGTGGLIMYGPRLGNALRDSMQYNLSLPREVAFDTKLAVAQLYYSVMAAGNAVLPLLGLLVVAALVGPIAMGGWLFSPSALMPKGSRINPLEGLKRMFAASALVELVKSLIKFVVLSGIAIVIISSMKTRMLGLSVEALQPAMSDAFHMAGWAILGVSCGMMLIALIDVPYQLFDHSSKLKMTKQEIKEEMKDSEGRPEVKGRIRQLQRDLARRRMMQAVPQADVIVTNPEHFAVALRYDSTRRGAPIVVAKGSDQIALKIREIGKAHNVALIASPTLARAIYYTTEIDGEIPSQLYMAVAQILAYVFQLKAWRPEHGRRPKIPEKLPVPPEMVFDQKGKRVS